MLAVVICVLIGLALLTPLVLARRRAPQERGLTPVFEAICSGRSGGSLSGLGSNLPIFRVSVYDNFLVICLFSPTVIPFAQLSRVEARGSFLGGSLLIETMGGLAFNLSLRNPERISKLLRHV
jgi:hypothetical protein